MNVVRDFYRAEHPTAFYTDDTKIIVKRKRLRGASQVLILEIREDDYHAELNTYASTNVCMGMVDDWLSITPSQQKQLDKEMWSYDLLEKMGVTEEMLDHILAVVPYLNAPGLEYRFDAPDDTSFIMVIQTKFRGPHHSRPIEMKVEMSFTKRERITIHIQPKHMSIDLLAVHMNMLRSRPQLKSWKVATPGASWR